MKQNWNFFFLGGGGGAKQKTFCGGEYGHFLELHIEQKKSFTLFDWVPSIAEHNVNGSSLE